jgi:hypothetical protein
VIEGETLQISECWLKYTVEEALRPGDKEVEKLDFTRRALSLQRQKRPGLIG